MKPANLATPPTVERLGRFHKFGVFGPAYEVVGPDRPAGDGDWYMRVVVLESGEEVGYLASNILNDPAADD